MDWPLTLGTEIAKWRGITSISSQTCHDLQKQPSL
uniref:Uncharacterized protein n=1 Tax=Rhizophora mucronata TaxID=61149 RepID=A0A2P2R0Z9_RHIMU